MFVLQSLYPLNWLLLCFHSVSFSLLVYLRPPSYFKFATRAIKPHFPANSVFFLESEYYEWTCRNSKEINLAKLNSRISVEVLTLPVAAEPTLRATVHVQFYQQSLHDATALKNDFVLQARSFSRTLGRLSLVEMFRYKRFPQMTHGKHNGNRKQT